QAGDPVEVRGPEGEVFARGLTEVSATEMGSVVGLHSSELPGGLPDQVIHRDFLTVLSHAELSA
ncbi:MAG: glutamate 5-kinase, partial [bacterium]|nr:glutamate 5-kinase [bacterium]